MDYSGSSADSYNSSDSNASLWTGSYSGSQRHRRPIGLELRKRQRRGELRGRQLEPVQLRDGRLGVIVGREQRPMAAEPPLVGRRQRHLRQQRRQRGQQHPVPVGHRSGRRVQQRQLQLPGRLGRDDDRGGASGSSVTSDTWTQQSATTATLGGTQQQAATASYTYQAPGGSGSASNNGSTMGVPVASTPVVQFGTPDATVVAAPNVGQLVGTPAVPQPGASGPTPGGMAPVPISVNLQLVTDTSSWAKSTRDVSREVATTPVHQVTLHGDKAVASSALQAVVQRVDNMNFAATVYSTVLLPAMRTASWLQGSNIGGALVSLLSLADPDNVVAAAYFHTGQPAPYSSTSSDPLVRYVDNTLYNNGQPLTAGSMPIYGTYFDRNAAGLVEIASGLVTGNLDQVGAGIANFGGTSTMPAVSAGQIIPPWLGQMADVTADAMMRGYIQLPFVLASIFVPGLAPLLYVAGNYTVARAFGEEYTWQDAGRDFVIGAGMAGLAEIPAAVEAGGAGGAAGRAAGSGEGFRSSGRSGRGGGGRVNFDSELPEFEPVNRGDSQRSRPLSRRDGIGGGGMRMAEEAAGETAPGAGAAGNQTLRDILTPGEQAEFEALSGETSWMDAQPGP